MASGGAYPMIEASQEEFVFYINGKPVSKYQSDADARRDMAMIDKKYPEAHLELKQEVCNLETIQKVNEGSSLAKALSDYPKIFDNVISLSTKTTLSIGPHLKYPAKAPDVVNTEGTTVVRSISDTFTPGES